MTSNPPCPEGAPDPPLDLDQLATDLWHLAAQADGLRYDCVRYDRAIALDDAGSRVGWLAAELRDRATKIDTHNRTQRAAAD